MLVRAFALISIRKSKIEIKNMEKYRTLTARKYHFLSTHRSFLFKGHKKYEQSLIVVIQNNGGNINFTFTDLANEEVFAFDNPSSGKYEIKLVKGNKMKLLITSSKAIGSYKIIKKTIKE